MKPIITDIDAARKAGMLTDGRYFFLAKTATPLFLPIWYGHRLDLKNMLVTESMEEIDARPDLPDLNRLVDQGYVLEATIYRCHDIEPAMRYRALSNKERDRVIKEFKEHGFNVTREAIEHNYNCWLADLKSGYRDEENGYHLFTPCGCNALTFRATSLEPELNCQKTYEY